MASNPELEDIPVGQRKPALKLPAGQGLTCVPWASLAEEVGAWDSLASAASEPNPFFESWYLLPSLHAFDQQGTVSILRFEQDGELRGILPIVRQWRYYDYPLPNISSWLHANCFLGTPLIAQGAEVPFWQSMLSWADDQPGAALFLHMREISLAGPVYAALQGVLAGSPRQAEIVHYEERAMLSSDLAPDAYLETSLSSKKRKELRRQMKRLSDEGEVTVERLTDTGGLSSWTDQFLALEASGWKGRAGSALAAENGTESLFRSSLQGAANRGKLERLSLLLNGQPIVMLATFLTPPGAFSYKTAFNEHFSRFSPGVLLQRENLAMLNREDVCWTDSCASADHPMIDHIWRERRALGRISIAIGGTLRRSAFRQIVRREVGKTSGVAAA